MERRRFILLSLTAAVAAGCQTGQHESRPAMLSSICDEKTLREIGQAYLQKHPGSKDELRKLVLNARAEDDFRNNRTIIIKGWVLSVTEARQCALLTL